MGTTSYNFMGFHKERGVAGFFHVLILLVSVWLVVEISIDTFNNVNFLNQPMFLKAQFWVCVFFIADFVFEFFFSDNKWHYLKTRFIFLIVSIPYIYILQHYHLRLTPEESYFLRLVPLIRSGYALAIVVGWLTSNRASSLFMSYLTMLVATVYFASLIFFVLESKVNPQVKEYNDALWWACMDVTTVGCDISAITPTGRIMSVVLAALGMMMFPIFTVYITSIIETANKNKSEYYDKLKDGDEHDTEGNNIK
jgi:hypothetical protein